MIKLIVLLPFVLVACSSPNYLTNEEIVKESKYCTDNNMIAIPFGVAFADGITMIQCYPRNN